jgi:hypothetical protein
VGSVGDAKAEKNFYVSSLLTFLNSNNRLPLHLYFYDDQADQDISRFTITNSSFDYSLILTHSELVLDQIQLYQRIRTSNFASEVASDVRYHTTAEPAGQSSTTIPLNLTISGFHQANSSDLTGSIYTKSFTPSTILPAGTYITGILHVKHLALKGTVNGKSFQILTDSFDTTMDLSCNITASGTVTPLRIAFKLNDLLRTTSIAPVKILYDDGSITYLSDSYSVFLSSLASQSVFYQHACVSGKPLY